MAILTITVPDELVAFYGKYDKNPAKAMGEQLKKFANHDPMSRVVVLPDEVRQTLEEMIGLPIEDPRKLVDWVRGLVSAKIGGLDIKLTDTQMQRIRSFAKFWCRPGEEPDVKGATERLVTQAIWQRLGA